MRISDWSSDVCSSDLTPQKLFLPRITRINTDRATPIKSALSAFVRVIRVIRGKNSFTLGQRGIEVPRGAEGACVAGFVDAARQAGEHLAGAAPAQAHDPRRRQRLDDDSPTPRQVNTPQQRVQEKERGREGKEG